MEVLEYYNNTLCIQANWLSREIGEHNYKNLTYRNQLQVVRRGGNGRTALIDYGSIPERYLGAVKEKLGSDPGKVSCLDVFVRHIVPDAAARDFYDGFIRPDGRHLSEEHIREYYTNATVLNAVVRSLKEKRGLRASSGNRVGGIRGSVFESVRGLRGLYGPDGEPLYPHTLPDNDDRLGRTLSGYRKEGYVYLIHGGFGRRNAAKVDDDVKESILIELIGDGRNADFVQVAELYNIIAVKRGWKTITAGAVRVWAEKYELEVCPGRHGKSTFENTKMMQAKRRKPTYPLYFWSLDGWDVELLYRETSEENGRRVTTYHNRPCVVVVLDPCVNYPIGYAVGTHETPALIRAALRNASNHTAELFGARYRVNQLQSDRYALAAMLPYYECLSPKVTPAAVGNAKSKPIERYFGSINNKYCHLMPNWSGFGVTSGKERQPNADRLNDSRGERPDFAGVCRQVSGIMELLRAERREQYVRLWEKTPSEHKHILEEEKYLLTFGSTVSDGKKQASKHLLHSDGITLKIGGKEETFDCFDLEFRRHAGVRWTVLFDPDNTAKALAVNDDRTLRFMLENKYVQPMALLERTEGDSGELQRIRDFNTLLKQHITDVRAHAGERVRETLSEPDVNDTLTKLILVDSSGQHKDRRNENRRRKRIEVNVEDVSPILIAEKQDNDDEIDIYKRF
jgi:hypothetical protein